MKQDCKLCEIPIWLTRQQIDNYMPNWIIINATEIYIQRFSDHLAQKLTFFSYINHNTIKALAGIMP